MMYVTHLPGKYAVFSASVKQLHLYHLGVKAEALPWAPFTSLRVLLNLNEVCFLQSLPFHSWWFFRNKVQQTWLQLGLSLAHSWASSVQQLSAFILVLLKSCPVWVCKKQALWVGLYTVPENMLKFFFLEGKGVSTGCLHLMAKMTCRCVLKGCFDVND